MWVGTLKLSKPGFLLIKSMEEVLLLIKFIEFIYLFIYPLYDKKNHKIYFLYHRTVEKMLHYENVLNTFGSSAY